MASTTVSAGNHQPSIGGDARRISKDRVFESIGRLNRWLEKNDYRGYDTFDGLNARYRAPTHLRNELPAHGAATRGAPVSAQSAPAAWDSQESLHQGHGLSRQEALCVFSRPPATNLGETKPSLRCSG